jgi:HEAT repeat protein
MKGEIALLDPDPIVRLRAVDDVGFDAMGLHALRDRLLDDRNGFVRAAVAERLSRAARAIFDENSPTRAEAMLWLIDALADSLGSVRELVCRAIVRHGERGAELEARLAELLARDPLWRVRRAAARALAAVAGPAAIPTLITGLEDPFWRVRQGVIEALSLIVTRSSADEDEQARLRAEVLNAGAGLDEAARAALAYLAGGWPEGEAEVPAVLGIIRDPGAGLELVDPDPAVVTARLLAARWVEPDKLVPLLAESHVPLREEAARRLAGVEDPSCLIPALAWLEDPRLPNAPAAVRTLLDRLGSRAGVLAEHALVRGRPGALAWAASWVATNAAEHLHASLLEHVGHPSAEVRAAVVAALGRIAARDPEDRDVACEVIERGLQDPARAVRDAAALALLELRVVPDARAFSSLSASVRAAIVGQGASEAWCELALRDEHPDVRAAAVAVANPRSRALGLADPDPRVRRVALDLTAACECMLGDHEHDPEVRRAAARVLVREVDSIDRAQLPALRARMYEDDDPWLRARASELVDPRDCSDEALAQLLCATRDTAAMARASAAAQLDAVPDLRERLERVLAQDGPSERQIAAWSRLITLAMASDVASAQACLEQALVTSTDAEITAHLRELAVLFGADPPARAPARAPIVFAPRERPDAPSTPMMVARPLGRSGIELAPLVVSGRFSPTPSSLAHALEHGVDTLFWEPTYTTTTRFLRQPRQRRVQVIAGSFHADRAGLTHDLEQARRRLEREHIDVFLLFWVRSVARIGAEALDTLREFQARGWIRSYGFSTHDRAIACAAIETGDWPVVMTRHSAAHDGAERELLPAAAAAGVGVLGFSALCYGRMLQPSSVFESGPAAADCYRYSLSQPAVAACISAPQRNRELLENLDVLARPTLDPLLQEALRAHGREVYADSKRFDRLLRRGGAAPLREAILELFERACEPPDPEPDHQAS